MGEQGRGWECCGEACPWSSLAQGGQHGTWCPSGLPPVTRELVREQTAFAFLTHRCHLTDTLAPACVDLMSCVTRANGIC